MLSDRERRILARIERHLVESDPDLARLLTGELRVQRSGVPIVLLVAGLAMLVLGSLLAVIPVTLAGMAAAVFALFVAHTQPNPIRRAGFA